MQISTRLAPPNSVVLVEDLSGGEIPTSLNKALVTSTASCIAVGCRAEDDGETDIVIGPACDVDTGERPVFIGILQTPSRWLSVRTVHGVVLLEIPVLMVETKLKGVRFRQPRLQFAFLLFLDILR